MESNTEDPWVVQVEARLAALKLMLTMLVVSTSHRTNMAEGLKGALDAVASTATTEFDKRFAEELDQLRDALL